MPSFPTSVFHNTSVSLNFYFITNVLIFQVFVRTRYLLRNQYLQDIVPSISLLSRLSSSDSLGKTSTTVTFSLWQLSTCLTNITANIRVKHRNVSVRPENVDGTNIWLWYRMKSSLSKYTFAKIAALSFYLQKQSQEKCPELAGFDGPSSLISYIPSLPHE